MQPDEGHDQLSTTEQVTPPPIPTESPFTESQGGVSDAVGQLAVSGADAPESADNWYSPDPDEPFHAATTFEPLTWVAPEFIAHPKTTRWYLLLGIVTIVIAAIFYLITKDKITTTVILVAGILFGFVAARKPRDLPYSVAPDGIHIGNKFFRYDYFRSFAVVPEGLQKSIVLLPMKRFSPLLSLYYDAGIESELVGSLSNRLPIEEYGHDIVERLMHRIHF